MAQYLDFSPDLLVKAQKVKLLVCDVDGVLTNGLFYYDQAEENKCFHVHDGLGIQLIQRSGIPVAIVSAKTSPAVTRRMAELDVEWVYQGCSPKLPTVEKLIANLNLTFEQIAYIGDDLADLALIRRAGLGVTVANARPYLKSHADWISPLAGGSGAVRELTDLIMTAQNTLDKAIEAFL